SARHDADDRKRFSIQRDIAINDRRIAIETSPPERLTQNNNMFLTDLIFTRQESPAERGCNAENGKDIGTHELAIKSLRLSGASQIDIQWSICAEGFERLVLVAQV